MGKRSKMLIALSILSAYPTDGRQAATFLQLKMGFGVYQSISYNLTMKRFGTSLCLLGSLACSLTVRADDQVTPDNPYAAIVARNVFGLVPPPPPAPLSADAADRSAATAPGTAATRLATSSVRQRLLSARAA